MQFKGINSRKSRILIYFLVLAMLVGCLAVGISAQARTVKTITVSVANASFRSEPKVESGNIIGYLVQGDSGEVLDEAYDSRPVLWYKATINGETGWVSSACVTVTEKTVIDTTITPDGDFEAYLTAQGFPESYKVKLRELHEQYPNWIFEAQHTNLDWNYVIQQESALGKTLVSSSSKASWKSTQNGAYDWENNKWIGFDGSKWVMASKEIIEHYMDPRNFLDSTYVFQFLKQSYDTSSMTAAQIATKKEELVRMVNHNSTYLAGTYTEDGVQKSYVDTIMSVAASTGVDPLMLASMMIQEQGVKGTGGSISGTVSGYEGYYNYFNIGAYDDGVRTAVERGLWYAKGGDSGATSYGRPWNNRTKSITGGASYYGKNYVNKGQDTMYLKKFNVDSDYPAFTHEYMTNVQGAASEGKHIASGYDENARTAALVFKIPIYNNMPATACVKPTGNLNPNYMLKSLSVSGYSLTPTFSMYETSYSVIVPNNVSSVSISATTVVSTTSISGTGDKSLAVGPNTVNVTAKAENGTTRTYSINIVRQAAADTGGSTDGGTNMNVSVTSSSYKINSNNTITGITNFPISASDFAKKFTVTNGSLKITNSSGVEKSGNVGTGDQVKVYDLSGKVKYTYNVVIYGDANGDGKINAKDLLSVQKNNIRISFLSGAYLTAADVNKDGKVNAKDLLAIQKNNIKISTIQQ